MKILLITTSYGSYSDSHTIRLANLFNNLSKNNDITICYPGDLSCKTIPGLKPLPVGNTFKLKILELLRRYNNFLFLIFLNLLKKFTYPDMFGGFNTLISSYFNSKCEFSFDIIISASGSLESHLAGFKVAKYYNVPLICDYGDPISPLVQNSRKRTKTVNIESKILKYASSVIFTTNSTRSQYLKFFKFDFKSFVIPYGFNSKDILNATSGDEFILSIFNDTRIKFISHIGTAFVNDRNLIPLIDSINEIDNNLGFVLAGRRSKNFSNHAYSIELDNFIDLKTIDYNSSLFLQKNNFLNVIVGNKDGRQVPGKVFIAIGCCQPILYISQCDEKDDEALSILNGYPYLFISKNNKTSIKNTINIILNKDFKDNQISDFGIEYDVSSISGFFERVLNECKIN